ncbi:MAG: gamma-glutamyl-gamma-aminobutyrate hydrolase family protein [Pseudomonadota bacterium]
MTTPASTKSLSEHRPLVLISADQRSFDGYMWHVAIDTYIRAVNDVSDLAPVIVPALGKSLDIEALLGSANGLVLTGSRTNVHPERYGQTASKAHEPYDPSRDATTLPLVRAAVAQGMPVLAICRGHQELNVAFGGTLDTEIQEIDGRQDHRGLPADAPPDVRFKQRHTVQITADGCLASILGEVDVTVNSVHRQAVSEVGDGLAVEAQAEDGTVEALSVVGAAGFTLGVQWHPEHWASQSADADTPSTKIFRAFGNAVRDYAATRSTD